MVFQFGPTAHDSYELYEYGRPVDGGGGRGLGGGCGVGDGRDGCYDGGDAVGGRGCSRGGSTGGGGGMGGTSWGWDTKDAR